MASVRKRTSMLPPLEVGAKRKHSVNRVLEECKENLAPAQNSRSKKPRLVEQPGKVDAPILKLDLEDVLNLYETLIKNLSVIIRMKDL